MVKKISLILIFILMSNTVLAGQYEDCILENLKGINNENIAQDIKRACMEKYLKIIALPKSVLKNIDKSASSEYKNKTTYYSGTFFNQNREWTITSITLRMYDYSEMVEKYKKKVFENHKGFCLIRFRDEHPEFNHIESEDLAAQLYRNNPEYHDMDFGEFAGRIGVEDDKILRSSQFYDEHNKDIITSDFKILVEIQPLGTQLFKFPSGGSWDSEEIISAEGYKK